LIIDEDGKAHSDYISSETTLNGTLHCLGQIFCLVGPEAESVVELPVERLIAIGPSVQRMDVPQLMDIDTELHSKCHRIGRTSAARFVGGI
jgi:hypothetical protein